MLDFGVRNDATSVPDDDPGDTNRAQPRGRIGTKSDAALGVLGIIASAVPFVGGPSTALVNEIRREFDLRDAERLAAVVADLAAHQKLLAGRVETKVGKDGVFAAFLEAGIESAATARNAEKRQYYVALMARSATIDGPEALQRSLLLDTLDRLRHSHLALLHAIAAGPHSTSTRDYYTPGTPSYEAVRNAMPGIDDIFLHRAWEDMVALGLLSSWTNYLVTEESPDHGGKAITPFGRAFLKFIAPF
jgi:hypothetical protein